MADAVRTIHVSGGRSSVSVRERIDGPDLVLFIHGIGCVKESFDGAWEAEGLSGYSLLAPDLPGHGRSPLADGFPCTMENYAAMLRELIGHYRFQRLHVVAHSLGGAPGLVLVRSTELPLASFTNIEGNLVAEDCSMLSRRAAASPFETFRDANLRKLLSAARESADPGLRLWAEWAQSSHPRAIHQCSISLVEWTDGGRLLDIYRGLAVPRLYVYGERSANPAALGAISDLEVKEIPDCGHFVMNERPEVFYPMLARFIGTGVSSRNPGH